VSDELKIVMECVKRLEPEMVELQKELVRRPSVGPESGGEGEKARVDYLVPLLRGWGLEVTEYRAPDPRVPCGYRPSIVARLKGRSGPCLWLMTHLDIVPAGARELWNTDPFEAVVKDGRIYGRGTEDNQQEMVASCFAVKAFLDSGIVPARDVALMLVADEETGSGHGAGWLLDNHDLCRSDDLVVVPDAGNGEGTFIEVAEKSIAWVRFAVQGRQGHASVPSGNAHRVGANLLVKLDRVLHEKYDAKDELFRPEVSTFEPTKKEANVPNINTIPGEDVFYFDCRVLPQYRLEDLLADMKAVAKETGKQFGMEVEVGTEQFAQAAPATDPDAPVVKLLTRAIKDVYGKDPTAGGIGGGTVAAFFRRRGIPAAVWGKYVGTAHNPNEYCLIENMAGDAQVYARMLMPESRKPD